MTKQKILDRISKLLARAKSDNPHEAALAAAMAAELQLEHQISEAEIAGAGDVEPITQESIDQGGKLVSWKAQILMGVASSLGADCFTGWKGRKRQYYAVGPQSTLDTVRYMYDYLVRETMRLADEGYAAEVIECDASRVSRPSARAWKGSFRVGCALAIKNRLVEQRRDTLNKAKLAGKSEALVVIDNQRSAIKEYIAREVGTLRVQRSSAGSRSRSGMSAGRAAGQSVSLGGSAGRLGAGAKRLGSGS